MTLNDRFAKGFVAGLFAGIIMNIVDHFGHHIFKFPAPRFIDWAAVLIYGHISANLSETVFAQIGQLLFASLVGIVFAYLTFTTTSKNLFLKGWVWATTVWFGTYALTILFKLPGLTKINLGIAILHFIAASVYGLALAAALQWLDNRNLNPVP